MRSTHNTGRQSRIPQPPAPCASWAYFIDVDGTLVQIADVPDGIAVDARLRNLLSALMDRCGGALALVSGRKLGDLDHHLAPMRLPIAGQHGLEHRDASGRILQRTTDPAITGALRVALLPVLSRHPALLLEDKGQSLALHYRRQPRLAPYLHRLMAELVASLAGNIELQRGKRVIEARPAGWDKGTAIAGFLGEPPFRGRRPVFIGDDVTDENGFVIVNALHGISIKVGKGRTAAHYRLPNVSAVLAWLSTLVVDSQQLQPPNCL